LWCWYRRLRPRSPFPTIVIIIAITILTARHNFRRTSHQGEAIAVSPFFIWDGVRN
jgi:hypothetical protein